MWRPSVEKLRAWCVERRVELGLFGGFALLYGLTAYPGPGGRIDYGGSAWLQALPLFDGVPRGTGHPTHLALSDLFEAVWPAARAATRVTALSVVAGAIAVALFGAIARRVSGDRVAAALAAALFGVSTTSWTVATEAQVYALHLLFVVSTLLALIAWRDRRRPRDLLIACLLHALAYGNEPTSALMLPTVAFVALATDWRAVVRPKRVVMIAWCAALGAAQYLGVLWPSSHLGPTLDAPPVEGVVVRTVAEAALDGLGAALAQGVAELSVIGVALAVLGAASWRGLDRVLAIGLGLLAACSLLLGLFCSIERGLYFQCLWLVGALALASALARIEGRWLRGAIGLGAIGLAAWQSVERGHVLVGDDPRDAAQAAWIAEAEGCEALLAGPESEAHARLRVYLSLSRDHGALPLPRDRQSALALRSFCFTREHLAAVEASPRHRVEILRTGRGGPLYRAVAPERWVGETRLSVLETWGTEGEPGWVVDGADHTGAAWDCEGCLRFVAEDAGLVLGVSGAPVALALAADNNDAYAVWCDRGGGAGLEHVADVPPVEGWGITERRVEVPDLAGCTRIGLAPSATDGASSIAEVRPLVDARLEVIEAVGTLGDPAAIVDGAAPEAGTPWDCEGCLRFVEPGAAVVLEVRGAGSALLVTADNNDVLGVSCDRGDGFEDLAEVPAVEGWGLATRRVEAPALAGCARLRLAPLRGDGASSIAEIELVP